MGNSPFLFFFARLSLRKTDCLEGENEREGIAPFSPAWYDGSVNRRETDGEKNRNMKDRSEFKNQ